MSNTEFNWFTELDNAIKAEPTDERCKYLSDMAGSWVTCPCGQLCKKLPQRRYANGAEVDSNYNNPLGAPEDSYKEDSYLYANGSIFSEAIQGRHWKYAKIVLERIEKRTIELLKALN